MHHGIHHVHYLWLIPLLPLLGAATNILVGHKLAKGMGERVNGWIAVSAMLGAFGIAVYAFVELLGLGGHGGLLLDHRWEMLSVGQLTVNLAFAVDPLSAVMLLVVTGIGTLIHVYATGYMAGDHYESNWRFFGYFNLFIFFMLLLVLGDNFIVMFFGWEGVGLCSYLLISYYYRDTEPKGEPPALPPAPSGMKAFVVNRIGDFAFIVGLFLLFWGLGGTWEGGGYSLTGGKFSVTFREVAEIVGNPSVREHLLTETFLGMSLVTAACIFFFIGATGKSAQIPLFVWLPDAMAGPTPVSALIHAATMVTAGVYMIARLNFLFALSPTAMTVVAAGGAATALFAATIGFFQWDIKKVLAYSTVSQLGFMFMGVGVGAFFAGVFHLMTHAAFKACLFLGSGSVIHGCHHEQDMRKMGGLKKYMPLTYWTYLLATLAIAGVPLFSGFFSKDEILWNVFANQNTYIPGPVLWFVGVLAAGCTSFYMMRTVGMTFSGDYRGGESGHNDHESSHDDDEHGHGHTPHESPRAMTWVLAALAFLAIVLGFVGVPAVLGGSNHFHHFLHPVLPKYAEDALQFAHYPHVVEYLAMAFTICIGLGGLFLGYKMYWNRYNETEWLAKISPRAHHFLVWKYKIDEAYDWAVKLPLIRGCANLARFDNNVIDGCVNLAGRVVRGVSYIDAWIDARLVDGSVNLVGDWVQDISRALRTLQTGRIQSYAYGLMAGLVSLLILYSIV